MGKRPQKPVDPQWESYPDELEDGENEWTGFQVGGACCVVLAVLFLGWLGWQNLVAAGFAGAGMFAIGYVALKLAKNYLRKDYED